MLRRKNTDETYNVPKGWSRIALTDDCDPWFAFIVQMTFEDSKNYKDHDRGLLTFIKKGAGEIWDLVELPQSNPNYKPPTGWKIMALNEQNVGELQTNPLLVALNATDKSNTGQRQHKASIFIVLLVLFFTITDVWH